MSLKARINDDMKAAMRAREAERLGTIRLLLAAIKQREVDERVELDDGAVTAVIDKMIKQRKDSIGQYEAASREDLAQIERDDGRAFAREGHGNGLAVAPTRTDGAGPGHDGDAAEQAL